MKTDEQHNDDVAPNVISKYLEEKYERRAVRNFLESFPMFDNLLEHCGVSRVAIFESKEIENTFLVFLYTEKHEYRIHVTPTYMGCGYSCRYHRPLEDWTRGNDLPDGKCTKETLDRILMAILTNELVSINE